MNKYLSVLLLALMLALTSAKELVKKRRCAEDCAKIKACGKGVKCSEHMANIVASINNCVRKTSNEPEDCTMIHEEAKWEGYYCFVKCYVKFSVRKNLINCHKKCPLLDNYY